MKMNSEKCNSYVVCHKFEQIWANVGTDIIWESASVKLLARNSD